MMPLPGSFGKMMPTTDCKMVEEATTDDLCGHICTILPQFMERCFVKRQQALAYKHEREAIDECADKDLLQVDFSENYTCMYQDEIQSAHWQQHQVSMFTVAFWHSRTLHSKVIVSDNPDHSKETVGAYVDMILETIPASVKSVSIWSDGPASQFKNRYIAAALHTLQAKYKLLIYWNFFATSHGKGPVDGIGGAVKRYVWSAVKARKHTINNAPSFVEAPKDMQGVAVTEMSTSHIESRNNGLKLEELFVSAPAIKGIALFHHLSMKEDNLATFVLTNDAHHSEADITQVPTPMETLIKVDDDTAYKRWSCHSGFKLLCKLCRTSPPMGARFTGFFWHAGHADPLDGWRCCSQKRVMSRPIQVRQL